MVSSNPEGDTGLYFPHEDSAGDTGISGVKDRERLDRVFTNPPDPIKEPKQYEEWLSDLINYISAKTRRDSEFKWQDTFDKYMAEVRKDLDDKVTILKSDYKKKLDEARSEIVNSVKKRAEDVVNNLLNNQLWPNVISVFGIFASVTTFVLTEIQVFGVYCDPSQILGLSLIFAAVLLLFIFLLLSFYRKSETSQIHPNNLGVIFGTLILVGALLFAHGAKSGRCYDGNAQVEINNNSDVKGVYGRHR